MKSPFLVEKNTLFAIQCFAALKRVDLKQRADWFLYNHIVGYALYDPCIHTVEFVCKTGNLPMLKYLVD